ncbi:hydrolase [Aureococcus anophagefferens]|nr:hydrolase [Aureococcus anophagefferens]
MGVVAAGAAALLLYNGTIRTDLRSADALAEALCTNDETIYAVGTRASVARACPDATLVDLGGATVLPGLTDAHCHVMLEAAAPPAGVRRVRDGRRAAIMAAWAGSHGDAAWLLGNGFDQTTWPGGAWPTKADLDGLKKPTPRLPHLGPRVLGQFKGARARERHENHAGPARRHDRARRGRRTDGRPHGRAMASSRTSCAPGGAAVRASVDDELKDVARLGLAGLHDLAALPGDVAYYAAAGRARGSVHVFRDAAHGYAPPPLPWKHESALVRARAWRRATGRVEHAQILTDADLGRFASLKAPAGEPAGLPDQRVGNLRALRGYTRDAAFAAFREDDLGAVAPGYAADLSVFDVDLAVAARAILKRRSSRRSWGGSSTRPTGRPSRHRAAVDAAPPDLSAADAAAIAAAGSAWGARPRARRDRFAA